VSILLVPDIPHMAEILPLVCSRFHHAVELIGSRWTGAIIQTLLQGRTRYAVIKSAIPDITDRMLSERLRSLEEEGVVIRKVLPETPVRVEYELTPKGKSLEAALKEISTWAERWILAPPAVRKSPRPGREARVRKPLRGSSGARHN
jgi:DNA-binding HxlR family transcriptional regulator